MNLVAGQIFFSMVPLTIALIHFFLFVFEPRVRRNLYFAILAAAFGALAWLDFEEMMGHSSGSQIGEIATGLLVPVIVLSVTRFIYALFYSGTPRMYRIVIAAVVVYLAVLPVSTDVAEKLGMVIVLGVILETFRVIVVRYRKQEEDLLLPTIGIAAFGLFGLGDMLLDLELIDSPIVGTRNPYLIGGVIMLLSMSIHLAREFARKGRHLEEQLVRVTELSARTIEQERAIRVEEVRRRVIELENERKGQDLAEARALQLSMLPGEMPRVSGWEIAAEMRTASEVGGDYYDVHVDEVGATVIIGDAVGHGSRAGNIVTATKSAFHLLRDETDVALLLERIDTALRRMKMKRAHMALAAVRLEGRRVTIASAGMPPALIRRVASGEVEELLIPRAPLGSMEMPFGSDSVVLEPGDLMLLMTDGLPELQVGDEMMGYDGVAKHLLDAPASAQDLVDYFLTDVAPSGDGSIEDDITMVAIRATPAD